MANNFTQTAKRSDYLSLETRHEAKHFVRNGFFTDYLIIYLDIN